MDGRPAHHCGAEPAVQRDDLRVGETNGVEERAAEDQKEDDRGVQQDSLRAAVGDGADHTLGVSVALDVGVFAVIGGDDEPVDVHNGDRTGQDPKLDRAAKVSVMALPDGDPLLLVGRGGDLGDGALELARGAKVVTPDGDEMAEHDGQETDDGPVEVECVPDKVGLDACLPEHEVVGKQPSGKDADAKEDDEAW